MGLNITTTISQELIDNYQNLLGENDILFLQRVYAEGIDIYVDRLKAIGFINKKHVLDAGAGFGQWSLALSQLNNNVSALDIEPHRLIVLQDIIKQLNITNIDIRRGELEALPYDDNAFDAIFCYGVIFCTNWKKSLSELCRVLRGNGVIYCTANDLGWYLHLWKNSPNATTDYNPRENAAQSFWNTIEYEKYGKAPKFAQIIIPPKLMIDELEASGLSIIQQGGDGTIHTNIDVRQPQPFFPPMYDGYTGVYETLAIKKMV